MAVASGTGDPDAIHGLKEMLAMGEFRAAVLDVVRLQLLRRIFQERTISASTMKT